MASTMHWAKLVPASKGWKKGYSLAALHTQEVEGGALCTFKIPEDTRSEWIRLKNRERKVKENIRGEHEKTMTEARAERQAAEEARQAIDSAAGKLGPIADLWEAVAEKVAADPSNPQVDFEAADAAFLENAKISIDDYMRLRARRSIGSSSDAVRLRVENQKLKRQLEGKPSDALKTTQKETSAAVETSAAAEASVPAKGKAARDWSGATPRSDSTGGRRADPDRARDKTCGCWTGATG